MSSFVKMKYFLLCYKLVPGSLDHIVCNRLDVNGLNLHFMSIPCKEYEFTTPEN